MHKYLKFPSQLKQNIIFGDYSLPEHSTNCGSATNSNLIQ